MIATESIVSPHCLPRIAVLKPNFWSRDNSNSNFDGGRGNPSIQSIIITVTQQHPVSVVSEIPHWAAHKFNTIGYIAFPEPRH